MLDAEILSGENGLLLGAVYCALVSHFFIFTWPAFSTAFFTSSRSTADRYLRYPFAPFNKVEEAQMKILAVTRVSKA